MAPRLQSSPLRILSLPSEPICFKLNAMAIVDLGEVEAVRSCRNQWGAIAGVDHDCG